MVSKSKDNSTVHYHLIQFLITFPPKKPYFTSSSHVNLTLDYTYCIPSSSCLCKTLCDHRAERREWHKRKQTHWPSVSLWSFSLRPKSLLSKISNTPSDDFAIFVLTSCQPSSVRSPSAPHTLVLALCDRRYWLLAKGILVIVYELHGFVCTHIHFTQMTMETIPSNSMLWDVLASSCVISG